MAAVIVSTTLFGPGAESTVRRAIESLAPHVDRSLVLVPPDGVDRAVLAGLDVVVRVWPWQDDFAAARNAALDHAAGLGARWAVTVDADEWIESADELRPAIAGAADAKAIFMLDGTESYWQPRAIRLPCAARWDGRVHECLAVAGPRLARARFCEAPKSRAVLLERAARDEAVLRELVAERPHEDRWLYYLGDALSVQERWEEAVDAFVSCAKKNGWYEQSAWSCFRAGDILSSRLGRHDDALEVLAAGLARHAGIAELPWMAALACARCGRLGQAVYWAHLARVHGERGAEGGRAVRFRLLWRVPLAVRGGPDELLEVLHRELGGAHDGTR